MSGTIDAVPPPKAAPEQHLQESAHGELSQQHLHKDCNLADSANRSCSAKRKPAATDGTLDLSAPIKNTSDAPNSTAAAAASDKPADGAPKPASVFPTEAEYMKAAPAAQRSAYGLPKDATSKQFVDKLIGDEVNEIQHAPKDAQKRFLDLLNVDKQTQDKILANGKDSAKNLADLLLKQERAFLEIPPTLQGESAYKEIEKGIEHNDYQAINDVRKLREEMSKP